jgi:hypothetical protein
MERLDELGPGLLIGRHYQWRNAAQPLSSWPGPTPLTARHERAPQCHGAQRYPGRTTSASCILLRDDVVQLMHELIILNVIYLF